jgi:hypothetical protein
MFRRRRPLKNESIHFSFDSFLDLVTNVVGIIIRLILVTWVGARSYHASMQFLELEPLPALEKPRVVDDPLHARIEQTKNELDDAKTRLLAQLKELEEVERKTQNTDAQLAALSGQRKQLEDDRKSLAATGTARGSQVQQASFTVDDVRKRSRKLLDEIKILEESEAKKKLLKYHAPLSKAVQIEEMFFECKNGRVTYIDLPAFMNDVKLSMDEISRELRTTFRVERTTSSIGSFKLRYAIERERTVMDVGGSPAPGSYRYGLSEWVVEPLTPDRGETVAQALREKSTFRQLVDPLDPNLTAVTFWVYPDSFELFRKLRDHLYDRGHDIAGRPLPAGASIAASRHGTASRGQ